MNRIALLCASSLIFSACSPGDPPESLAETKVANAAPESLFADTVYTNGKIFTMDENQPWAEAVAIKDGSFVVVGSVTDMTAVTGDETNVVDLGGKFVMPGLHDLHVHFEGFYNAAMLEGKTLRYSGEETSIAELQSKLRAYADANPDLEVLFAEQLPQALFPNLSPTRAFIDEIVPDRPVVMLSDSEHEALLNTVALGMEGITADTPEPFGGEIIKGPNGQPTGFLKERAAGLWGWPHFPELSREQHQQGMHAVISYLNSLGVTTAKEQHAKNHWAQGFKDVESDGELTMRIGLSWTYKGPLEPSPLEEQEEAIANRGQFESELINPNFVKLSIDGTAGTTGLVIDPYEQTGDFGIAFYDPEELVRDIARFDELGLGITAHANADGAVRQFLDALEQASDLNGGLEGRHQVAHAILIHPDDLARFKTLNATAEFSPVMWFPSPTAAGLSAQLGLKRTDHVFPMRSLKDNGGRFVIASDGPLAWQVPLVAIETAVTRQLPGGSHETLGAAEAIDLETAIRAYTLDAAYLMGHDNKVGSIEKGKVADMIILDRNLFEIPATQIGEASILKSIFNGAVVFDASVDPTGEEELEEEYDTELDLDGENWGHKP